MSTEEREELTRGDAIADEQDPREIEVEIERTRERMSSNIGELGERLRPDHLKQQAKDAIAGKAQDVVAHVGDQARLTGGRMIDFITEHPLPVAAAGLGAIGLFTLRRGTLLVLAGAAALGVALGRLLTQTDPEPGDEVQRPTRGWR